MKSVATAIRLWILIVIVAWLVVPLCGQTSPWSTGSGGTIYYNGGNVGIGTTSPTSALEVNGHLTLPALKYLQFKDGSGTLAFYLYTLNTGELRLQQSVNAPVRHTINGSPFFVSQQGGADLLTVLYTGNVGIGTTNPHAPFEVAVTKTDNSSVLLGQYLGRRTSGTAAAGMGVSSDFYLQDADGSLIGTNKISSSWIDASVANRYARMDFYSSRNNTSMIAMSIDYTGNVGIGTTAPQYKLAVNGTIGTKEVIVTNTGWADYVLRPGYKLKPLSEVEIYVRENHRLPEMPSEAEVKEKGVGLGDMQVKLLAKIEELTLHMIQLDETNRRLERQNGALLDEIEAMRDRISNLESR